MSAIEKLRSGAGGVRRAAEGTRAPAAATERQSASPQGDCCPSDAYPFLVCAQVARGCALRPAAASAMAHAQRGRSGARSTSRFGPIPSRAFRLLPCSLPSSPLASRCACVRRLLSSPLFCSAVARRPFCSVLFWPQSRRRPKKRRQSDHARTRGAQGREEREETEEADCLLKNPAVLT